MLLHFSVTEFHSFPSVSNISFCIHTHTHTHTHTYTSFSIHLSVDGHLGCSHILSTVNRAAMKIGVCVSFELVCSLF